MLPLALAGRWIAWVSCWRRPHMRMTTRALFLAGLGAATLAVWACSSTPDKASGGEAKSPEGPRELAHEKCDDSMGRVAILDSDHDGKPELKQVFDKSTGKEICRVADLNHDGKPDMYEYYDADGNLRRREGAYDNTDAISEIRNLRRRQARSPRARHDGSAQSRHMGHLRSRDGQADQTRARQQRRRQGRPVVDVGRQQHHDRDRQERRRSAGSERVDHGRSERASDRGVDGVGIRERG